MKAPYLFYYDGNLGFVTLVGSNVICCADLLTCIEALAAMERDGHTEEPAGVFKSKFLSRLSKEFDTPEKKKAGYSKTMDFYKTFGRRN